MPHARSVFPVTALLLTAALCSCASSTDVSPRPAYHLEWTATRTADQTALSSVSMKLPLGSSATVNTGSKRPGEDLPAFPRFTARLSRTKTPGVFQLVTRAELREETRTRKGKGKITRRNIGALLPIRVGETQEASLPGDPVHLEVLLTRD